MQLKEHLRASHIKPWRESSNVERLDGDNGFLLAPHVDHLFDKGFISFNDQGGLLVSELLDSEVLDSWNIDKNTVAGHFTDGQKSYLKYHRDNIFQ